MRGDKTYTRGMETKWRGDTRAKYGVAALTHSEQLSVLDGGVVGVH